jgi:predicted  nucleic acid-binding Zn-ribbon protein
MTARLDLIQCLRQLDELDKARSAMQPASPKLAALAAEIEALRQRLPTAILKHYDQRRARNKPAIAPVRRGICGGCHVPLTRSSAANLHRNGGAIHVCENCGAFIYPDDRGPDAAETSSAR